jgi:hypothetical protein
MSAFETMHSTLNYLIPAEFEKPLAERRLGGRLIVLRQAKQAMKVWKSIKPTSIFPSPR